MPDANLYIPYENIVYIGDSATDIPCMRLVKSKGGYSIGVFDPEKNKREKVYQLLNDGRINFYAPADYSEDSELFKYIKLVIDQVSINERIKAEQYPLKNQANVYGLYKNMQTMADLMLYPKRNTKSSNKNLIICNIKLKVSKVQQIFACFWTENLPFFFERTKRFLNYSVWKLFAKNFFVV